MGPRRLLPWSGPGCLEPRGAGGAGVRRGDAGGHGHLRCSGTLSHGQGGGQPMTPVDILTLISGVLVGRSEEHTSELQSLMRISYAVFCLKKKTQTLKTVHDI